MSTAPGTPVGQPARELLGRAQSLQREAADLGRTLGESRQQVEVAYRTLREEMVRRELATIPVARLRESTGGRLRLGTLEKFGYGTVLRVLDASPQRLQQLPGIGAQTATQAVAAARQVAAAVDPANLRSTALVTALHRLHALQRATDAVAPHLPRLDAELAGAVTAAGPTRGKLRMFFRGARRKGEATAALRRLPARRRACGSGIRRPAEGSHDAGAYAPVHDAAAWVGSEQERVRMRRWSNPRSGRVALSELARPFVGSLAIKPKTLAGYESLLRTVVLPTFGSRAVEDIRPSDVREWMAALTREGVSPSRIRQGFRLLSQVLSAAEADGRIGSNPCRGIKTPRLPETHPRVISQHEAIAIADHCAPPYDLLVLLMAFGGLRIGEALALRRRSVDIVNGRIVVSESLADVTVETGQLREDRTPITRTSFAFGATKTHQQRTLSLPRFVMVRLARHLQAIGEEPTELLFTSKTRAPVRYASFRRHVWDKAVEAVGAVGVKPHDLRASHASWLIDAGFSVVDVAARLGHSSAAVTTKYYARPVAGRDQDIAAALDRLGARDEEPELARPWHIPSQAGNVSDPATATNLL